MRFVSTRGKTVDITFEEALFTAYTEDGGLLMPETIPNISLAILQQWKGLSYVELVKEIIPLFVSTTEISLKEQQELIDAALSTFDIPDVLRIERLTDDLNVLEMWHGKTLAFKDLAMSCTTQFVNYFLKKRGRHFTAVVVTSGDTGSSAMQNSIGLDNLDIIVMFAYQKIAKLQELMMTTIQADNMHVYAVDAASSDDSDELVEKIFTDHKFVTEHSVGTLNSQNWCRIMVQIVHHVYAYLQTANEVGEHVDIIIPVGGFGNTTSCLIAKEMGIPLGIVCVSNKNDFLNQVLKTGVINQASAHLTLAPAMDIAFPINFERILWLLSGNDGDVISKIMKEFRTSGSATLPADLMGKVKSTLRSASASDDVIINAIQRCWKENEYHICPHTATAVACFYGLTDGYKHSGNSAICLATASAAKFSEAVTKAGLPLKRSPRIDDLNENDARYERLRKGDDWQDILYKKICSITAQSKR
ncbi:threonine synthase-like 2 [Ciona intestinalis]